MKLKFNKIGINGEGIGKYQGVPVFCDGVLLGEIAEIQITKTYPTYQKAQLKRVIQSSNDRVKPLCPYQKECGGCGLMHASTNAQLQYKKELLKESLYKYGHVKEHFIRDIHPSRQDFYYRSACKLPVKMMNGKLVTGMYQPNSNRFIPIKECIIHTKELEAFRKDVLKVLNQYNVQDYDTKTKKGLRYLVLRYIQNQGQCTLVTGDDVLDQELIKVLSNIPNMTSLYQSVNTKHKNTSIFGKTTKKLSKQSKIKVQMHDIVGYLSPESFFQLNVEQALNLYDTAISKIDSCDLLVEAYCGIGMMSLLAHNKAKEIIGIESIPEAIHDANQIAKENGFDHIRFQVGDAAKVLQKISKKRRIDALLVDPPRSGLDEAMLETILKSLPEKVIYVSCNPSTLGKDIRVLKNKYYVRTIIPFDLFPQTPLCESVVVLSLHK